MREGASVSAPLHRAGEPWGAITVVAGEKEAPDDQDVASLEVITVLASTCISHAFEFVAKETESRIDPITGLTTGMALGERIGSELARARRAGEALSLVLFEIDGSDALVDRGPGEVERAVRAVADALRAGRASDIKFRLGTVLFAVLMPGTDRAGAEIASIRLAWSIATAEGDGAGLTVTSGVAQPDVDDAYAFIAAAEVALGESKAALAEG
jgi:GGDEF domain-containing protein